jgi:hypothetical protein
LYNNNNNNNNKTTLGRLICGEECKNKKRENYCRKNEGDTESANGMSKE